ncbi:unnamed protein product [Heterotrigona itama]|uniref:Uncharacterized protein n=1 Tax=Heterotrigona itama TaxID=395501 RepID=A0A6V7HJ22_9HYME|nr:unnamed protein product [Heterotrigona itama]
MFRSQCAASRFEHLETGSLTLPSTTQWGSTEPLSRITKDARLRESHLALSDSKIKLVVNSYAIKLVQNSYANKKAVHGEVNNFRCRCDIMPQTRSHGKVHLTEHPPGGASVSEQKGSVFKRRVYQATATVSMAFMARRGELMFRMPGV